MFNKPYQWLINLAVLGVCVVTLAGGVYLVAKTVRKEPSQFGGQWVTIEGTGKTEGTPTVSQINIGVTSTGRSIATVYKENTGKMNAVTSALGTLGIATKDLQTTSFSIDPEYSAKDGAPRTIQGYSMTQTLTVKVRDLTKLDSVMAKAVDLGVNDVSGPTFTVEDDADLLSEARAEALADAENRRAAIENALRVKLKRLATYSEWVEQPPYPYMDGKGGGEMAMGMGLPEASIQPGYIQKTIHVTLGYEIE